MLGAALYLPEEWLTATARARARIPAAVTFRQRWRLALTLLRQIRASGIRITAVIADAEFGDNRMFRGMLHRLRLPYAVGGSRHLRAFLGTPRLTVPRRAPGSHRTRVVADAVMGTFADLLAVAPPRWQRVQWRNHRGGRRWAVECTAIRVTPTLDQRHPRLLPEVWLLAEREARAAAPMRWHHHVVLTAVAYNFLQAERRRGATALTFPAVRAIVQEIFTAYLFAQRPQYLRRIEALKSVQLRI